MTEVLHEHAWPGTTIYNTVGSSWASARFSCVAIPAVEPADSRALQFHPCIQQQIDQQGLSSGHAAVATSGAQQLRLYSCLLQQLDALGWSKVAEVSPGLNSIALQLQDAAGRVHPARVLLPAGFPAAAPVVSISLPQHFKSRWLPGHTLTQLVAQLEQVS